MIALYFYHLFRRLVLFLYLSLYCLFLPYLLYSRLLCSLYYIGIRLLYLPLNSTLS
jgi:hypothetical protein